MTSSAYTPRGSPISISTRSVVKSSIEPILTLPFWEAPSIDAIRLSVVVPNGISRITTALADRLTSITARNRTRPAPFCGS